MSLFLSDVEVEGVRCSVTVNDATVVAVGPDLVCPPGARRIDAQGGMLLPGLNDHHVHLLSSAAALQSISAGPPEVRSAEDLRRVLHEATITRRGAWIRAIGYHESVAGPLDRYVLDQMVTSNPLRIQHRSGAMWFLNSLGLEQSGLDSEARGVERDDEGRLTGRLWRSNHDFGVDEGTIIDELKALSATAASHGVTGFTDATPSQTDSSLQTLTAAHRTGVIRQRLTLMISSSAKADSLDDVEVGPVKVLLDDLDLPALDELAETIGVAHRSSRAVAIHCVTDLQATLALSAIDVAGPNGSDRIEHGSLIPPELDGLARACRVTVVTQPHFIKERGDEYLLDLPEHFHESLYRARSLIDGGVLLAGGTDAPFGSSDPWVAIASATRRLTRSGAAIGPRERLTPMQAIDLFTGDARTPGRRRRIEVGIHADLCLLSLDTNSALEDLSSSNVRTTVIDGRVVFEK